jgi:hypothetical protein
MAQNDFVIADQSAVNALTDINIALQSLASCSSGASEPATKYANQLWYDTTANILKMRNEANSAWISLFYVHQSDSAMHILDNTYTSDTSGNHVGLLGDQTTATWQAGTGTTESLVSPAKLAAAVAALAPGGIGSGQTWQNLTSSRGVGTSYQNTTGKPICVNIVIASGGEKYFEVSTNNSSWVLVAQGQSNQTLESFSTIVPNGHYYRARWSQAGSITWAELR